ncbi:MAG: dehydrogenase, partial [Planctomycetota bacterium]
MRSSVHAALSLALLATLVSSSTANPGNRLAWLQGPVDPYYVSHGFPRLTTHQWTGDPKIDAVVVLAIDDMRDVQRYERFLRPILDRLKRYPAPSGLSIMTNRIDPADPHLQRWLQEGVSLETHTLDHPCPLLQKGNFAAARRTYEACVDLMASVPGSHPVAFRMPCCDSRNTPSPRFWQEIFNKRTEKGHFLQVDSSVFQLFTPADPELPRDLLFDDSGAPRFARYVPFPSFVNLIYNYPYPYVIGRLCWEFPCMVPSDWEAQHVQQPNNPRTVQDWCRALDAT